MNNSSLPSHRMLARPRGFTLIETMIGIGIVGLMTMLSYPSISEILTNTRINRASSVLALDLAMGFSIAARQRSPVQFSCTAATLECRIVDVQTGDTFHNHLFGPESSLPIDSIGTSVTLVNLYPTGLASSDLTITLATGTHVREITMSRAGHVRVIRQE